MGNDARGGAPPVLSRRYRRRQEGLKGGSANTWAATWQGFDGVIPHVLMRQDLILMGPTWEGASEFRTDANRQREPRNWMIQFTKAMIAKRVPVQV